MGINTNNFNCIEEGCGDTVCVCINNNGDELKAPSSLSVSVRIKDGIDPYLVPGDGSWEYESGSHDFTLGISDCEGTSAGTASIDTGSSYLLDSNVLIDFFNGGEAPFASRVIPMILTKIVSDDNCCAFTFHCEETISPELATLLGATNSTGVADWSNYRALYLGDFTGHDLSIGDSYFCPGEPETFGCGPTCQQLLYPGGLWGYFGAYVWAKLNIEVCRRACDGVWEWEANLRFAVKVLGGTTDSRAADFFPSHFPPNAVNSSAESGPSGIVCDPLNLGTGTQYIANQNVLNAEADVEAPLLIDPFSYHLKIVGAWPLDQCTSRFPFGTGGNKPLVNTGGGIKVVHSTDPPEVHVTRVVGFEQMNIVIYMEIEEDVTTVDDALDVLESTDAIIDDPGAGSPVNFGAPIFEVSDRVDTDIVINTGGDGEYPLSSTDSFSGGSNGSSVSAGDVFSHILANAGGSSSPGASEWASYYSPYFYPAAQLLATRGSFTPALPSPGGPFEGGSDVIIYNTMLSNPGCLLCDPDGPDLCEDAGFCSDGEWTYGSVTERTRHREFTNGIEWHV